MDIIIIEGQEEHANICNMYWELDDSGDFQYKMSEISSKYGVKANSISGIVKQSSIAYSDSIFCVSCGQPLSFRTRTDYLSNNSQQHWICPECVENENKRIEEEKAYLLVNALERSRNNPVTIDSLSFRHAVLLLALVRFSGSEDLTYIKEISSNKTDFLSPEFDFDLTMLKELYRNNIIAIDPESNLDAIELKENDQFSFYLDKVSWLITLNEDESPVTFIRILEEKLASMEYVESSYDEVVALCKELSLIECLSYLEVVIAEHQLNFKAGEKTHLVLSKALESFSVSQVYNFIWRSAKDAAAFYLRSGVSKNHAANTIVGNIQKQCERALANNWNVTAFRRNYDKPQSIVSQVLFNLCLHTDDGGFTQQLSKVV